MQITTATKLVGLIGHPVAHSLSPVLHNSVYQSLGLDMVYHAFDVTPDKLETAIDGFLALGFLGFNVTIPYKEKVYNILESRDAEAQIIGAVNTVKIENGILKWSATNQAKSVVYYFNDLNKEGRVYSITRENSIPVSSSGYYCVSTLNSDNMESEPSELVQKK